MDSSYDVIIIGGGAAGFFSAINIAQANPRLTIAILERGKEVLTKVKISGGGRCNVTHAQYIPKELSKNYPRGEKELLGPFHQFMTGDTIEWFQERGVALKTEDDGRVFPLTDSSQTIINCFLKEVNKFGVSILKTTPVKAIEKNEGYWVVTTNHKKLSTNQLVVATGSNPKVWKMLEQLGHTIEPPVPSLFTFHIKDERIANLPGISKEVSVQVLNNIGKPILFSEGTLLITHWGVSGPVILKLSAWGARLLETINYTFKIKVNWLIDIKKEEVLDTLLSLKFKKTKQTLYTHPKFDLPKRLWKSLLTASRINKEETWADISKKKLLLLAEQLTEGVFQTKGKSSFKEEFVTAGGVNLKEIHFKTFESKLFSGLYFAGEVLNIDAITGGFNFQNAWTGGYIVAQSINKKII